MFLSLDGVDGAGKSTQLTLLIDWLREQGRDVVACRDPGGTPLGDAIRDLLLHRAELTLDRVGEMFLYMASRAQLVAEVIRPALAAGRTVVSDRFLLANVVYQGHAGGLDPDAVREIGRVATGGLSPDLTIVLDVDAATAAARMNRPLDRMESRGSEFRDRVRAGFLAEARRDPRRIVVIDAAADAAAVQHAVRAAVAPLLTAARET